MARLQNKYVIGSVALSVAVGLLLGALLWGENIAVLNPKGTIASQQRDLIFFALALSAIIVIPVYVLTFFIAWKYRASNKKATYQPKLDGNRKLEFAWWAIPCVIITILGVVTWKSSHTLDPYRPLKSSTKPIPVQVIALQWKWLFIYPEQNIATVNHLQFPTNTPLNFQITADAPMNSFWIPQLGGQVYAMAGMTTKLHLIANEPGDYTGSSANISGESFADMKFSAKATSQKVFDDWVRQIKRSPNRLNINEYDALTAPGTNSTPIYYGATEKGLYDTVINKYMKANQGQEGVHTHTGEQRIGYHH